MMSSKEPPIVQAGNGPTADALAKALAAPCRVVLAAQGDKISAVIPELGILARGADPAAAHAEALRLRELRLREFAEEGLLHELPSPVDTLPGGERLLPRLRVFLIKAAVVSALFLGAVNIISGGLRDVGYVLEKKLDAVATWSPDTVEKHRERAELIAKNLGPILREFTKAMAASPQDTAQATGKAAPQGQTAQ